MELLNEFLAAMIIFSSDDRFLSCGHFFLLLFRAPINNSRLPKQERPSHQKQADGRQIQVFD
jgi:hypothetical protein